MQKAILLFMMCLVSIASVFSQNIISGIVKDETGAGVPFATLKFHLKDSTAVKAEKIADATGTFMVQVNGAGSYTVDFSAMGYKDTSLNFTVSASLTNFNLFVKRSEKSLNDVTVTTNTHPPMIQRKIDRVVMNVENNALTSGKSSLDIFKLAPGVFVNNGAIAINGV